MQRINIYFEEMPFQMVREFAKLFNAEIIELFREFAHVAKVNENVLPESSISIEFKLDGRNHIRSFYLAKTTTVSVIDDKETGVCVLELADFRKQMHDAITGRFYLVLLQQPPTPEQAYEVVKTLTQQAF